MNTFRTVLLVMLITLAGLAVTVAPNAHAVSNYCSVSAQQPYFPGNSTVKSVGSFSCHYGITGTTELQVCIYQDGYFSKCSYGTYSSQNASRSVSCSVSWVGGPSYYQTFTWIRDAYGGQATKWSSVFYTETHCW